MNTRSLSVVWCLFLFACAGETPTANDPSMVAPAPSAPAAARASPSPPCRSEPATEEFDTVLKGAVASEHRHCPYVVEAEVTSATGGIYDHIVRPTPDEVLFEVCAPGRPTGEASCAVVLAPTTVAGAVPGLKRGDKLLITGRSMEVKGMWVLDATKVQRAE
ncbi:MAG: hypothetical protein HY898_25230 [Deltaproteobacteria bacterium]|nr:hypothetical protein [Deltaproteobacteria bacterium]